MAGKKDSPEETHASVEVRAVVDRIEDGDIAVLSLDDEAKTELDVPRKQLPKDANSDGDHLLLTFAVKAGNDGSSSKRKLKSIKAAPAAARSSAEDRIKARLARLSGAADKKNFKL